MTPLLACLQKIRCCRAPELDNHNALIPLTIHLKGAPSAANSGQQDVTLNLSINQNASILDLKNHIEQKQGCLASQQEIYLSTADDIGLEFDPTALDNAMKLHQLTSTIQELTVIVKN